MFQHITEHHFLFPNLHQAGFNFKRFTFNGRLTLVYYKSLTISVKIGFFKIFGKKLQNIEALNLNHLFHIYSRQIDLILEALASVLSEKYIFFGNLVFLRPPKYSTPSTFEKPL